MHSRARAQRSARVRAAWLPSAMRATTSVCGAPLPVFLGTAEVDALPWARVGPRSRSSGGEGGVGIPREHCVN